MSLFRAHHRRSIGVRKPRVARPHDTLRASADGVPGPIVAKYYEQRAGIGLLRHRGRVPERRVEGVPRPARNRHRRAGRPGWAKVADAVHAEGGVVFHAAHERRGRVTHTGHHAPTASSPPRAIAIEERHPAHADGTKVAYPVPHALETEELATVRDEFVRAARRAVDAGIDGVELHSANGYLLQRVSSPRLQPAHRRLRRSPEARARFVIEEVAQAVVAEVGADRSRHPHLSRPQHPGVWEHDDAETRATYEALIAGLAPLGLAYLSVCCTPTPRATSTGTCGAPSAAPSSSTPASRR